MASFVGPGMVGRRGLWHGTDAHARAQARSADIIIHLKFRQTTAYKVRVKSGGKVRNCLLNCRYQRTIKNFITRWKKWQFSIWKYGLHSIDQVAYSGPVKLEQCDCRSEGEGGQGAIRMARGQSGKVWARPQILTKCTDVAPFSRGM